MVGLGTNASIGDDGIAQSWGGRGEHIHISNPKMVP